MIDILENKQYITDINSKWTFFKFPNGKEDRVATNIKLTDVLLDYFRNEYRFYKRMYEELNDISDKKRKEVDKLPRHTEEEITHATLFEDMNMRTDNEKFKEKSYEYKSNKSFNTRISPSKYKTFSHSGNKVGR